MYRSISKYLKNTDQFKKKKVLHASVMTDMKKNLKENQFLSSPCFLTLISLGRIVQKAMDAKKNYKGRWIKLKSQGSRKKKINNSKFDFAYNRNKKYKDI